MYILSLGVKGLNWEVALQFLTSYLLVVIQQDSIALGSTNRIETPIY